MDKEIELICRSAHEKKAENIVVMDMRRRTALCDFFVVMSAESLVRVKTITEHIQEVMEKQGYRTRHREGIAEGLWVLLDYGSVIVHIFYHQTRGFYDLEHLWGDAPRREVRGER
jgi:ribosome-associated protein